MSGWTPIDEPFALDRYVVVGEIARGGMAEVLAAVQGGEDGVERLVAIKRILPELLKDQDFIGMMFDEARLVSQIRHPNVVQVYDYLLRQGQPHIVMEFLAGVPLFRLLRTRIAERQGTPPHLAAYIAQQAALGLHASHELRGKDGAPLDVVHRDISPQNIFLTVEGGVKVIDFGIAKAAHRVTRTQHGQLKGKLRYMSPEQLASRAVDRRSDIYSLGIVLAEVLSGELYFQQRDPLEAVAEREVERVLPPMDARLEAIVSKATSPNVRDRYGSAEELALDLERYLVEEGCIGMERTLAEAVRALVPGANAADHEIRAFSRTVIDNAPDGAPKEASETFVTRHYAGSSGHSASGSPHALRWAVMLAVVAAAAVAVAVVTTWRTRGEEPRSIALDTPAAQAAADEAPADDTVPEAPYAPETPDVPETPDRPETPDVPETSDVPETPDRPEAPETVTETPPVEEPERGARRTSKRPPSREPALNWGSAMFD